MTSVPIFYILDVSKFANKLTYIQVNSEKMQRKTIRKNEKVKIMNYKIKKTLKKSKNVFIIFGILWILLSIVLVSPIAVSIVDATVNRRFYRKLVY